MTNFYAHYVRIMDGHARSASVHNNFITRIHTKIKLSKRR